MKASSESKEQVILESARKFFFRYGFKKTSMDEIAADAGVSKGTLYNYFKNKEDLFIKNGEAKQQEFLELMQLKGNQAVRADDKLVGIFMMMIENIRIMAKEYAMSRPVLEELLVVGMDLMGSRPDHINNYVIIIEEGIAQGVFKAGDSRKRARVLTLIGKVFFLRWVTMDPQQAEAEIKTIFEVVFDGFRK